MVQNVTLAEVNVVENVDRAVDLGVLTLPSIVIDGKLVFTSMPPVAQSRGIDRAKQGARIMDAEALRQAIEQAALAAAGVAFLAGLAFSFNPVVLASIPASLAYVTRGPI